MKLTDQKLRGLKAPNGRIELSDEGYPMALIVTSGGTKSFYYRGRQNGKSVRKKIGSYPDMSLATARAHALSMKLAKPIGQLHLKPTPIIRVVQAEDSRPSVNDIFAAYMKDEGNLKKDGGASKWQRYEREVQKNIGTKKIADITHDDLSDLIADKYEKGFPAASNSLQSDLSRFFRWSVTKGRRKSGLTANPMLDVVKLASPNARTRYLSKQEIGWFFQCLPKIGIYGGAFESILFTVARKSEIMLADWTNLSEDKLSLKDTKNGLAQLIWLHPAIRQKHFSMPLQTGRIFQGSNVSVSKPMDRLRLEMKKLAATSGVEFESFSLHDLRRTGTTHMASFLDKHDQQKISNDARDKILNHKPKGIQGKHYNMYDNYREKKAAWKLYGDWLENIRSTLI
jgi:integrase